jgi:hypothetical protein
MRWFAILALWVVAIVLAVIVLRRVRSGRNVVLSGRWSPRVIRTVAVVLVVLGVGEEARTPEAQAAPTRLPIRGADDELPKTVNPHTIELWLIAHQEDGAPETFKKTVAKVLTAGKATKGDINRIPAHVLPPDLYRMVEADLAAVKEGKPLPKVAGTGLQAALDAMEKQGRYDHFWNAYLWRKTATADFPDANARVELYSRFRQHARITDALIRAHAQVKPIMASPRAWMSKAGPRPGEIAAIKAHAKSVADMHKVAAEVLPTTDEGTWKRDGVALFRPVKDAEAPVLIRNGKEYVLPADESTRFGRLDLFKSGGKPVAIVHDWLGKVELPANRLVSVWDLPKLLPEAAKQKLDEAVHEALKTNSEDAADRLERSLAVSHFAIRAGLRELPNAKGAPKLRLILSLFDDAVMPPLPVYKIGDGVDEFGPGLRGLRGGPGR